MTAQLRKLSAREAETIGKPGRHGDGGGLYLVIEGGEHSRCTAGAMKICEPNFEALLVKSRTGASVGCASYSRGFIEPAANFG
jgi:hypothetical protein